MTRNVNSHIRTLSIRPAKRYVSTRLILFIAHHGDAHYPSLEVLILWPIRSICCLMSGSHSNEKGLSIGWRLIVLMTLASLTDPLLPPTDNESSCQRKEAKVFGKKIGREVRPSLMKISRSNAHLYFVSSPPEDLNKARRNIAPG